MSGFSFRILRIFILLTVFISSAGQAAAGRTIVAVQSVPARPYDEALEGFVQALAQVDYDLQRIILSESPGQEVKRQLDATKPKLVLAIGMDALTQVADLTSMPVVYVMVLNPPDAIARTGEVTGVRMLVAPEKQLLIVQTALPKIKTIGLLYDPQRSGQVVSRLQAAAERMDISIIAQKVTRTEQVPQAVLEMSPKIDLLWMLPDLTVVAPDTVEFLLLFAMESGKPLITFSEKYVEQGAVLSIASDTRDMGRQAGQIALKILGGTNVRDLPSEDAGKAVVTINLKVARKMGLQLDGKILRTARILD